MGSVDPGPESRPQLIIIYSMKVKKDRLLQKKLIMLRRRIQDIPFYALEYGRDDLPLDPAKPFILEQIGRLINIIAIISFYPL